MLLFILFLSSTKSYSNTCNKCKCTNSKIKKRICIVACLWKLRLCRYIDKLKSCYNNIRCIVIVSKSYIVSCLIEDISVSCFCLNYCIMDIFLE